VRACAWLNVRSSTICNFTYVIVHMSACLHTGVCAHVGTDGFCLLNTCPTKHLAAVHYDKQLCVYSLSTRLRKENVSIMPRTRENTIDITSTFTDFHVVRPPKYHLTPIAKYILTILNRYNKIHCGRSYETQLRKRFREINVKISKL
jgi:hypothetical protein